MRKRRGVTKGICVVNLLCGILCLFSFVSGTESFADEKAATSEKAPPSTYTDPVTGMEFVYIRGGCFYTGIEFRNNGLVNKTCVDDYYIGKYEVTQEQWEKIMQTNPSEHKGTKLPVDNTSWTAVHTFIRKLNVLSIYHFRLPSDEEWEYAAQAGGAPGGTYWGDDKSTACLYANLNYEGVYEYPPKNHFGCHDGYRNSPAPVGSFLPNAYGLYDMIGNVDEWCPQWDERDYNPFPGIHTALPEDNTYEAPILIDARLSLDKDFHNRCGGTYYDNPTYVDTSLQEIYHVTSELCRSGVRLVLEVK